VGSRAKALDERVGLSSSAKSAFNATKDAVSETDEKLGVSKSVKVDHPFVFCWGFLQTVIFVGSCRKGG
jgi:hypothetical protein